MVAEIYDDFLNSIIGSYVKEQYLLGATVQATEEVIINAVVAIKTMEGINENKACALPYDLLIKIFKK